MKTKLTNLQPEMINLLKYAGVILTLLTVSFGSIQWLDSRYIDRRIYDLHIQQIDQERIENEQKLVRLIESIERERERDFNMVYGAIREAALVGLIVRRDILMTRGRELLTPEQRAELDIIETKIREMRPTVDE